MSGATPTPLLPLRAASVGADQEARRPHRVPARRRRARADGRWQVRITGSQGSGILRSMSEANGLVVLGHDAGQRRRRRRGRRAAVRSPASERGPRSGARRLGLGVEAIEARSSR